MALPMGMAINLTWTETKIDTWQGIVKSKTDKNGYWICDAIDSLIQVVYHTPLKLI